MTHRFLVACAAALPLFLAACKPAATPTGGASSSAPVAAASSAAANAEVANTIKANLKANLPQITQVDEVRTTGWQGMYEVRVNGKHLLYTDAQANYVMNGELLDARTKQNLTTARMQEIERIDFGSLPKDGAFITKQGDGSRQLAIFADPNCGYCRQLEQELPKLKNVTIHTYLIPILGADSQKKAAQIWCAPDRSAVWQAWMQKQTPLPESTDCDVSAIKRNLAFATEQNISGTPAIILPNGKRISGAVPVQDLEQALADATSK